MPTSKSTQKHKRFYAEWFVSNSTDIEGEDLSDLVGSKLLPLVQELVSGGMKFSSVRVGLQLPVRAHSR